MPASGYEISIIQVNCDGKIRARMNFAPGWEGQGERQGKGRGKDALLFEGGARGRRGRCRFTNITVMTVRSG